MSVGSMDHTGMLPIALRGSPGEQVDLLWCAASLLKPLYPQLHSALPDSDRGRVLVRLKAAHPMTQNAAAPPVPQFRHAHQPQHVPCRMQIDRTSKPESQAGGRAGDSERRCHPVLRPTREGRCEGQPTDATDIEAPQNSVPWAFSSFVIESLAPAPLVGPGSSMRRGKAPPSANMPKDRRGTCAWCSIVLIPAQSPGLP
jgi:hypothetical protein